MTRASGGAARTRRMGLGPTTLPLYLVRAYRVLISPTLPPACRFQPSCAAYAEEALSRRALLPALALIARRIFKCHPFHRGGYDPVP